MTENEQALITAALNWWKIPADKNGIREISLLAGACDAVHEERATLRPFGWLVKRGESRGYFTMDEGEARRVQIAQGGEVVALYRGSMPA